MARFTDKLKAALLEELQGKPASGDPEMESADGKGVADKKEESVKVSTKTTKTEIDLDGKNDVVDGDVPKKAPSDGSAATGDASMESADGEGIVSKTVKKDSGTSGSAAPSGSGAAEGDASMESADGKGVADKKVGKVAESFILPHDVMVEQDGKKITLKQGTRVGLMKEDVPEFLNKDGDEEEEEEEMASAVVEEPEMGDDIGTSDLPDMAPEESPAAIAAQEEQAMSAIDKIVMGMEATLDGFKEFAAEEKTEDAHGGEIEDEVIDPVPPMAESKAKKKVVK